MASSNTRNGLSDHETATEKLGFQHAMALHDLNPFETHSAKLTNVLWIAKRDESPIARSSFAVRFGDRLFTIRSSRVECCVLDFRMGIFNTGSHRCLFAIIV